MTIHLAITPGLRLRSGRRRFTLDLGSQPGLWGVVSRLGNRYEVTEAFIRERFEVVS